MLRSLATAVDPTLRLYGVMPLLQVAAGVLVGTSIIAAVFTLGRGSLLTLGQFGWIALYGTVMAGICLLACVVPTRRALRIEPTDALRMDV